MSPHPSPALAALRDATRDLHAELDRRSPLGAEDLDQRDYLEHAGRILGWLEPLERAFRDNRGGWPATLGAEARLVKSAWLESDLLAGGLSHAEVQALPRCADLPVATRAAQVFGVAYVMEGATLGGAYLYKRLAPRLPGLPLQWLQGYGQATGPRWQDFLEQLARQVVSPESIGLAQDAARATFVSFRRWVIDEA
ncbi:MULTISPECIES: biliverdin-producing heme oxygenase [Pseudomonas aeruginosa group]|uniref:biliverdin-producing heme oxygenase n=1 Tax=Pseudomonas aeruginosa group TaxID=136841 RepID=UPI00210A79C2|nr:MULTISPECIES: biliverdin-producing heme oxygenase [Pseudomonas aeruginosa group]MCW8025406.1 biliverdin-producing heme oxygenase [Pseudomonas aeruginosa]MDY1576341.1 biliverdin-producing heme oxygenase [Pseudomonas paraeruginosa]HBO7423949.1 biliverdin-producing heme oxygenase [Pseudomonas aeruginosa]HBP5566553.1 biliverdin-producing heme oxygenase [Pseudomonas aeruginosa]